MVLSRRYKWTDEDLVQEALKYKTRSAFCNDSNGAYNIALRRGVLDEICAHMQVSNIHPKWTKEELMQEALKYETRGAFFRKSNNAYQAARKRGILDEICAHMKKSK